MSAPTDASVGSSVTTLAAAEELTLAESFESGNSVTFDVDVDGTSVSD